MSTRLLLFAVGGFVLIFGVPGHGQDSPSLGDLAKQAQQAQRDKSTAPPKKVFTNDDMPSNAGLGSMGLASGASGGAARVAQPGTPAQSGTAASASAELEKMQTLLDQLSSVDRATLAKNVLQGSVADFPGRGKWEEQLFAAKQTFVARGRDILKKANQLQASAKDIQNAENPNDPRARDLSNRLQQLLGEASQSGAEFQAVIAQGKELATQGSSH